MKFRRALAETSKATTTAAATKMSGTNFAEK
jgi:hypothetical protein